ncbi:MAG TPA: glucose 1-dehydrogenase [Ktedonobacterales bacterium]|jgi:threonine dehydrogenase-like Zn-dependent dehydrogenase
MKAVAVFPGARDIRIIDRDEPRITHPAQVKLRMLEVGVCGTDKEICRFEYGTPPDGSDFLIIGHESLAEVVEVGPAATGVTPGELVVSTVRHPCSHPECSACQSGNQDFCATGDFTERGIKGLHGFMAEYVVDDARYLNVVPATLREVAVLVEPMSIAAKALTQTVTILRRLPWFEAGHMRQVGGRALRVLVLGAGAVGLLGALELAHAGFDTYVYDRAPAPNPKSRLVESVGATYVSEATAPDFAHLIGQMSLVYEATGASRLAFRALRLLAPNGIFIFTGVPALGAASEVETDTIMRDLVLKNQVILGTVNAGKAAYAAAISALGDIYRRWPDAIKAIISGRYPVAAYRELLLGQAGGIKQVLAFDKSLVSAADAERTGAHAERDQRGPRGPREARG